MSETTYTPDPNYLKFDTEREEPAIQGDNPETQYSLAPSPVTPAPMGQDPFLPYAAGATGAVVGYKVGASGAKAEPGLQSQERQYEVRKAAADKAAQHVDDLKTKMPPAPPPAPAPLATDALDKQLKGNPLPNAGNTGRAAMLGFNEQTALQAARKAENDRIFKKNTAMHIEGYRAHPSTGIFVPSDNSEFARINQEEQRRQQAQDARRQHAQQQKDLNKAQQRAEQLSQQAKLHQPKPTLAGTINQGASQLVNKIPYASKVTGPLSQFGQAALNNPVSRRVMGGLGGYQVGSSGVDTYNAIRSGDVPEAIMSGIDTVGGLAMMSRHPLLATVGGLAQLGTAGVRSLRNQHSQHKQGVPFSMDYTTQPIS